MIAQKVSFAFFNNLITHGLGFISLFFIARYMGPEALGTIAFAMAYLKIFATFSSFGFGPAHIKRVSEGKDFGICNGTYFTMKLLSTVIMAIVILLTIFVPKLFQHRYFISRQHEIVLYIMLLSTVIANFSMMFILTFGARKEIAKQQVPLLVEKVVEVGGKIFVALAGLSVVFLAGANLVGAIIALLCFLYLFKGYPIRKPNKEYFRSYLQFALPVMLIGFLSDIAHNMDKVMIQFFWTTADVGYYSAAQRITVILTFIITASATLIFPTISSYHSKNNMKGIRDLSNRAERYLSMIFFPLVAFVYVMAKPMCTEILGVEFTASAPLLVILTFVTLVTGITLPYTQQFAGTNRIMLAAKLGAVVFILDILLNLVFIPREFLGIQFLGLGGLGAAVSTLISMTVGAILHRFYAHKITASKPNPRVLLHFASALAMGICLHVISSILHRVTLYHLILFGFLGLLIYLFFLRILHEFGQKDIRFFLKVINPMELKNYAITEIKGGYIENP